MPEKGSSIYKIVEADSKSGRRGTMPRILRNVFCFEFLGQLLATTNIYE